MKLNNNHILLIVAIILSLFLLYRSFNSSTTEMFESCQTMRPDVTVQWCKDNCGSGYCPPTHCSSGCKSGDSGSNPAPGPHSSASGSNPAPGPHSSAPPDHNKTGSPEKSPDSNSGSWTPVNASVGWSAEPEYTRGALGCSWSNPGNMCWKWPASAPKGSQACSKNIYFGHGIGGADMKCGDCAKVRVKKTDGGYNELFQLCVDNPDGSSNEIGADARAKLMQGNLAGWNGNKGTSHQTADRLGFEYQKTNCNSC